VARKAKARKRAAGPWILRLYVAGHTPRCAAAIATLRQICDQYGGQYRFEVVDVLQYPELARSDEIIAIPTLVRKNPQPVRRIVGDLSNAKDVLTRLGSSETKRASSRRPPRYVLRLYVSGTTPSSVHAISRIKRFCDEYLAGRYDLEVIDIYQLPQHARDVRILALPALIRKRPGSRRQIVGALAQPERILIGSDLRAFEEQHSLQ
jgi:circadian clock protein KaiB